MPTKRNRTCRTCGKKLKRNNKDFVGASKYCSVECYKVPRYKTCVECEEDFFSDNINDIRCEICKTKENKLNRCRNTYHNHFVTKQCKVCGKEFKNKRKVTHCEECKKAAGNQLIHVYEFLLREVKCKKCNEIVGKEWVKDTPVTSKYGITDSLCKKCIIERKNRIRINNDRHIISIKHKLSQRKRLLGKKLNATIVEYSRLNLYPWIKAVFDEYGHKCALCQNENTNLQIHHLKPFTLIFNDVIKNYNVENIKDNYDIIANRILEAHSIEDGIPLCKKCHFLVDPNYNPYKNKSKIPSNNHFIWNNQIIPIYKEIYCIKN